LPARAPLCKPLYIPQGIILEISPADLSTKMMWVSLIAVFVRKVQTQMSVYKDLAQPEFNGQK